MSPRTLKLLGYLAWIAGLAALVALVIAEGAADVLRAIAEGGAGVLAVAAIWLLPMLADTMSWQRLLAGRSAIRFASLFWIRWIGEGVKNLLPVTTVGGDLLRAWLANRGYGVPGALAGASVVVDVTLAVLTQILFTFMGLAVLVTLGTGGVLVHATLLGSATLGLALALFFVVQRAGLFGFSGRLVERLASRAGWTRIVAQGDALDVEIRALYARRRELAAAMVWRLLAWLAGTLEVWAGLAVLGHPVSLAEAVMLESLIQAVRSAAFMVPGAYGVQEGALIVLGGVIGIAPGVALALSLLKRVREIAWGLPALAVWQLSALHRAWRAG
ncbi:MAG: lysylphosphatidylglycerol synthase domain-containing protein [Gammaproteobacteria bacterium]|nr:lysylphosphatidylglycerol synthase domain-containing protein [Gammaproteobacteria bacterium]